MNQQENAPHMRLHEVHLTAAKNAQQAPSNLTEEQLAFVENVNAHQEEIRTHRPLNWTLSAKQTWFWFRLTAAALFASFLIAWPLGKALSHKEQFGTLTGWNLFTSYDLFIIIYAIACPILLLIVGYVISVGIRITNAAEKVTHNANQLIRPDATAVHGVKTVGSAVRGEITALNNHVDDALSRLASVESMIRQQIKAIDTAGSAIETGGSEMTERVSSERQKLIELTEAMNSEADAFAAAIAKKAKLGINKTESANARLAGAERELEKRLGRLETIAVKAFNSFETLSTTLIQQEEALSAKAATLDETAEGAYKRTSDAHKALEENATALNNAQSLLEEESVRLEKLITEQRERADRLAATISGQADRIAYEAAQAQKALDEAEAVAKQQQEAAPITPSPSTMEPQNPIIKKSNLETKSHKARVEAAEKLAHTIEVDPLLPQEPTEKEKIALKAKLDEEARLNSTLQTKDARASAETIDESRERRQQSKWRDILAAADTAPLTKSETPIDAEQKIEVDEPIITAPKTIAPPEPAAPEQIEEEPEDIYASDAATSEKDVVQLIRNMQIFTLNVQTSLYETPQNAALERFEGGERNLFAHILLRHDEEDFKQRVQIEVSRNQDFSASVTEFLHNFDQLLEPPGGGKPSDNLLDDYLSSPLGQIYVLIGTAVEYFA